LSEGSRQIGISLPDRQVGRVVGSNAFKITTKLNGKVFAEDVFTISPDGKTLTDETTATATNEKTKSVFDRQ